MQCICIIITIVIIIVIIILFSPLPIVTDLESDGQTGKYN